MKLSSYYSSTDSILYAAVDSSRHHTIHFHLVPNTNNNNFTSVSSLTLGSNLVYGIKIFLTIPLPFFQENSGIFQSCGGKFSVTVPQSWEVIGGRGRSGSAIIFLYIVIIPRDTVT